MRRKVYTILMQNRSQAFSRPLKYDPKLAYFRGLNPLKIELIYPLTFNTVYAIIGSEI